MPSKRYWAKKFPKLDFEETVKKTEFFVNNYNFKKFIHISSVSARCQKNTIYGLNKKKSEKFVLKNKENLVIRLGPLYGENLYKGVLVDLLNSNTVFVNKTSKYSFTSTSWIANWIIINLNKKKGLIEVGSKDYIKLEKLKELIKSESKFYGKIDDQIILGKEKFDTSSYAVIKFLRKRQKI